jgi:universal stress protein A
MDYKHILVALDFSEASGQTLRRALDIARRHHARLTLLHVVDYLPPLGFADDFTPTPAALIDDQELLERGVRALERYAERHRLAPEVERRVELGSPRREIVAMAAQRGIDLIVIGSHGRHGLGRFLGSTANAVLNDAACDVLAVRAAD